MGSDAGVVPECHGEERAEAGEEGFDLPVDLRSKPTYHHELLVRTERIKSQMQAVTFHTICDTYPTKLLIPESSKKVQKRYTVIIWLAFWVYI